MGVVDEILQRWRGPSDDSERSAFWETEHANDDARFMGITPPDVTYAFHRVVDIVTGPACSILEIGVGRGASIVNLVERGHDVTAVDIAPSALARLAALNCRRLLTAELLSVEAESVDLVLCHLVLPHCSDTAAKFLICQAARVVRPTGVATFQFSSLIDVNLPFQGPMTRERHLVGRLHFMRTPERMRALVLEAGAVPELHDRPTAFVAYNVAWHAVRVTRPNRQDEAVRECAPPPARGPDT